MVINELEIRKLEKALEKFLNKRRPPISMRNQLDFGYKFQNQSVEILEIRPNWRDPDTKIDISAAKATYVKSTKTWKIYWQRADMKWHSYQPAPSVKSFEDFLQIVDEDANACFFG